MVSYRCAPSDVRSYIPFWLLTRVALPSAPTFLASFCLVGSVLAEDGQSKVRGLGDVSFFLTTTFMSDYRLNGYTQTNFKPSMQVSLIAAHDSGFFINAIATTVSNQIYLNGFAEVDLLIGKRFDLSEKMSLELGVMPLFYPGANAPPLGGVKTSYNAMTVFGVLEYEGFRFRTNWMPTNYPGTPESRNSIYLNLSYRRPIFDEINITASIGFQSFRNQVNARLQPFPYYFDYSFGLEWRKNIWVLAIAAIGSAPNNYYLTVSGQPAGRLGAMGSISFSFQ